MGVLGTAYEIHFSCLHYISSVVCNVELEHEVHAMSVI